MSKSMIGLLHVGSQRCIKHSTDSHCDGVAQSVLAAFIREGHLARHVRRMRPIYAARREALLDGLHRELDAWMAPIPSEAGLHLAARIRDPRHATTIMANVRRYTPGAQSTAEYAMHAPERPAVTFGYGVIDAEAIPAALSRLRQSLEGKTKALQRLPDQARLRAVTIGKSIDASAR